MKTKYIALAFAAMLTGAAFCACEKENNIPNGGTEQTDTIPSPGPGQDTVQPGPTPRQPYNGDGVLNGLFSVSATKQIRFSQGNLQYQASTNTWRFAEHQYGCIGEGNNNISSSYSGWIDLFGWGTGNNPTNVSLEYTSYSSFTDWGSNAISNGGNQANIWRTLTKDELYYLFTTRNDADQKYGVAVIGDEYKGMVVLPDSWSLPEGLSFTSGGLYPSDNYSLNNYTFEEWAQMEEAGAVFLPVCGYRSGTETTYYDEYGTYWSSSVYDNDDGWYLYFYADRIGIGEMRRRCGCSVRLVVD